MSMYLMLHYIYLAQDIRNLNKRPNGPVSLTWFCLIYSFIKLWL